jgi:hypothetical protein
MITKLRQRRKQAIVPNNKGRSFDQPYKNPDGVLPSAIGV